MKHVAPTGSPLEGLTAPNGTPLNINGCAPQEIIFAAFAQDAQLRNGGWRVYDHEKHSRGHHVNQESEWVLELTRHYGTRLFTMTPAEICDAYRKLVQRMNTVNHGTKLSRTAITMLRTMALWEQRQQPAGVIDEEEDEELAAA